jgi:hypothetical protein
LFFFPVNFGRNGFIKSAQLTRSMPDISHPAVQVPAAAPFSRVESAERAARPDYADFRHREAFVTRMTRSRPESLDRVSKPPVETRLRKSGVYAAETPGSARPARKSAKLKIEHPGQPIHSRYSINLVGHTSCLFSSLSEEFEVIGRFLGKQYLTQNTKDQFQITTLKFVLMSLITLIFALKTPCVPKYVCTCM